MRCYRRLVNISYKDHERNEDVHGKIIAASVNMMNLQSTLEEKKQKRWKDNTERRTWIFFANTTRAFRLGVNIC